MKLNPRHPRFWSLAIRDRMVKAVREGIAVPQGLIAHGRGEAFDYMMGEKTTAPASRATSAAAAFLLDAERPIISVNGNTAALVGKEVVSLSSALSAPIEVNLFHRSLAREQTIERYLKRLGAEEILGTGPRARQSITGISSPRRLIDPEGIGKADVVLVPLEDGDRAEALERAGKTVIAIDLNPLSRTSQIASVSIVDNVVRAVPSLISASNKMREFSHPRLQRLKSSFDNQHNLSRAIEEMVQRLKGWTRK